MYTLLSGFHKYLTRREEYYIVILGLDNAGKTTLLERIKSIFLGVLGLSPDRIAPTVGLNIGKIDVNRSRLNFWDLGGQRELHGIWEKYYSECHAIIFVVDSTDKERIEECKEIFEKIITNEEVEGVPVLMLANKQDLPNSLKVEEIKEIFNKIALKLGARDSRVLPISALEGEGVREAIDWLCLRLQRNKQNRPPIFK
ncbi:ADP-ribosylation factor family-domain-containing protein [Gigaspora rosea]|uniref:ADP-ribosylation factor family-domain-containing protein n=1 Tax=Gigaspora rosea TaxID=44941 RepID=A0A397URI2_9GLOM|nr:ADP-ribosylation factor family-domain-containing protein [Gigaspora rosea]